MKKNFLARIYEEGGFKNDKTTNKKMVGKTN